MTVVLAGVAADGINTDPIPDRRPDGRFEYVPIPEPVTDTTESLTYGTARLRHAESSLADVINWIRPGRHDDRVSTPDAISAHPLHHDPNFAALTYGESGSRPDYIGKLRRLESGDVLGFYAGLRAGERVHRYLIGCFTVAEVVTVTPSTSTADRAATFADHPENAHAKRYFGSPSAVHDTVAMVRGRPPGGLLARADLRLSTFTAWEGNARRAYYLDDAFVERFPLADPTFEHDPRSDHKDDKVYLGVKPALVLDMSGEAFLQELGGPDVFDETVDRRFGKVPGAGSP